MTINKTNGLLRQNYAVTRSIIFEYLSKNISSFDGRLAIVYHNNSFFGVAVVVVVVGVKNASFFKPSQLAFENFHKRVRNLDVFIYMKSFIVRIVFLQL